MKKLLIGLTILFSFLFINNVNASILNSTFVVSKNIFDDEAYRKTFINTYNGYNTYYDALINSDKYELFNDQIQNYNHKYYIYTSNRVYMWDDENLKVNAHALKVSSSNSVLGFSLSNTIINGSSTYYYTDISDYLTKGTISNKAVSFTSPIGLTLGMHSIDKSDSGWFYSSYIYNNKNLDYYYFIGFNTNTNIYFSTLRNSYYSSGSHYNKISVGGTIYNDGDIIYEYNSEPQLDISVIEKTDYLENIKINFNIWDTEKYIYEYKLTGMEVWEDITENDFEYISYSNNTIYIQMIDKTTNESILNATYTFSNITETIPDITFNESIPNSCKVLKNGTNYIVCKEIKANFNNYYGINNYLWSYSADGENWTQIYNDKFIDLISENKTIYFKLYDRNTNEILKYMTYNITGIELIPSDLGQYITFNGKYENNNYKLDIIFYNYDNELYNYYYSTDGENWTQLNIGELSNYTSIYSKYKSFNFYKDMTIYVKIEDKEANYITSATYEIKIPNVGLFDTINNFKVDNKILNYFTNIYNQIRTSDLGNYIFMLIVTSIILLIIKSARR